MFRTLLSALLVAPVAALAADPPAVLQAAIAEARGLCAEMDGGTLTLQPGALKTADLTGDGSADDWVLDEAYYSCSTAASLYCGSGGCGITFAVGGVATPGFARSWAPADVDGRRVVFIGLHGSSCGGIGADPCFARLVWDGRGFQYFGP